MSASALLLSVPGLLAEDLMPLIDAGKLPRLRDLIEGGALGFVREAPGTNITQQVWTIATGVAPEAHGVPGPYAVMPGKCGIHPIGRDDSRAAPLWEVSARQGLRSCAIAWPGTQDSGGGDLRVVTDDIHVPFGAGRAAWPLLPGIVHPNDWEAALRDLRVHPTEIASAEVDFFVGESGEPAERYRIAEAVAAAATVQAVTLHALADGGFRLIASHFDFLDRLRRLRSGAPEHIPPMALASGYRFLDLLAGHLRRTRPEATLILASPSAPRGPGVIAPGLLILNGPDVAADVLLGDVSLRDVAPAALHCAEAALPKNLSLPAWERAWKIAKPIREAPSEALSQDEPAAWALEEMRRLGLQPTPLLASFRRQIERLERESIA